MDETPHEPDKGKVTPISRGTSHRANASEDQRVQDEIQKLLQNADPDPPEQAASLAPLTESKVIIEQGRHGPPADHSNAMVCPQCKNTVYPKICPAVIVAVHDGDRRIIRVLSHSSDHPICAGSYFFNSISPPWI